MQALPLPTPCQSHQPFQRHQLEVTSKWLFDLRPLKVGRESVGASLPSPPMSRSSPQQNPRDPAQAAGRRRKRSESPAASSIATASASYPPFQGQLPTWPEITQSPFSRPPGGQFAPQLQSSYPPPPQLLSQPVFSVQGSVPLAGVHDVPLGMTSATGQGQSRATRKPKAHVASACVNCKKKHLRCDNARPCRRCVQAGKEVRPLYDQLQFSNNQRQESCVDVTHKKRGRPPLKADDPQSRRTFAASPSALPGRQSRLSSSPVGLERLPYPSERSPTSLRDLRPLQSPRQEIINQPREASQAQPLSTASAMIGFQGQLSPYGPPRLSGHRPFSSISSSASSAQPPSPFFPSPGLPPGAGVTLPYEPHSRSMPTTTLPSFSQPQITPTIPSTPIIPPIPSSRPPGHQAYRQLQSQLGSTTDMATFTRSRPPSEPRAAPQPIAELQLPPIRSVPSTPRPSEQTVQSQPSNLASSQTQASTRQTGRPGNDHISTQGKADDSTTGRGSKRMRMDLGGMLGPGHE